MSTLIKTDIEIATHVAMYGGTEKDALKLRQRSVPLARKKSSMSYLSAQSETDTAMATDVRPYKRLHVTATGSLSSPIRHLLPFVRFYLLTVDRKSISALRFSWA